MTLKKMVNGIEVECTPKEEAEIRARWKENERIQSKNKWLINRVNEYPSIADQMDMLWHAMDKGEIPAANLFYKTIAYIKERHAKK